MKRLLIALLLAFTLFGATAQKSDDFASRFLALYGKTYALTQKTISPKMMERIMRLESVEENAETLRLIKQLKSIRIVSGGESATECILLQEKANQLATRNSRRYKLYSENDNAVIYVRRKARTIVELLVINKGEGKRFNLINLTGMMSDSFIAEVGRLTPAQTEKPRNALQ